MEAVSKSGQEPSLLEAADLRPFTASTQLMRGRWIIETRGEGWDDFALSEWELVGAGLSDHHPHVEVNYVIEGELHVTVGDTTVVGNAGDTIVVPAGGTGSYWAPEYARMLAIYGANPEGESSEYISYWEVDSGTKVDLGASDSDLSGHGSA